MKIISVKKAEKQAKAYAKANPPVIPLGWAEEYAALQKQHRALHNRWNIIRDKKCPAKHGNGEICICKSLPEYPSYVAMLMPLTDTINAMAREEYTRTRNTQVYLNRLSELLSGIKSRKKYTK